MYNRKKDGISALKELIFLLVFIILSTAFAIAAVVASVICAPSAPGDEKNSTYECGMKLFSDARAMYDVKFFNYAIMFLIFDIETIFLFPFAINFCQFNLFMSIEVLIFLGLLIFALVYAIKKDVLRWQ